MKDQLLILSFFSLIVFFVGCQKDDYRENDVAGKTRSSENPANFDDVFDWRNSNLTQQQMNQLYFSITAMELSFPLMSTIWDHVLSAGITIRIKIDPTLNAKAEFDTEDRLLTFRSEDDMFDTDTLMHEFLHIFQLAVYGERRMGSATRNVEFEARVIQDIMHYHKYGQPLWGGFFTDFMIEIDYLRWIIGLAAGKVSPNDLADFNKFFRAWVGERYSNSSDNFEPLILFYLF